MNRRASTMLLPLLAVLLATVVACSGDEASTPTASPTPTATETASPSETVTPTASPTASGTTSPVPSPTSSPTTEPTSTPTAEPPSVADGEPVVMHPGDEVLVESGRTLRFIGVVNDSRCPVDVQCIWAGEATVQLVLIGDASLPVDITMPGGGTTTVAVGGLTFEASELMPAPRSTVAIAPGDYQVTITVFGAGGAVPPR